MLLGGSVPYRHADPYGEPLLWLPDMVAWALGKGPRWSARLPSDWRRVEEVDP